MPVKLLEKALQIGANAIEMEYKDGKEWIMAFRYNPVQRIKSNIEFKFFKELH